MFSTADRTQLVADLNAAANVQDGRQIGRLADHGLDLGIISEATAREITSLGRLIWNSTRAEAVRFADGLRELTATI